MGMRWELRCGWGGGGNEDERDRSGGEDKAWDGKIRGDGVRGGEAVQVEMQKLFTEPHFQCKGEGCLE